MVCPRINSSSPALAAHEAISDAAKKNTAQWKICVPTYCFHSLLMTAIRWMARLMADGKVKGHQRTKLDMIIASSRQRLRRGDGQRRGFRGYRDCESAASRTAMNRPSDSARGAGLRQNNSSRQTAESRLAACLDDCRSNRANTVIRPNNGAAPAATVNYSTVTDFARLRG
jgi:hypothetical protein